jgi:hypothetical protein
MAAQSNVAPITIKTVLQNTGIFLVVISFFLLLAWGACQLLIVLPCKMIEGDLDGLNHSLGQLNHQLDQEISNTERMKDQADALNRDIHDFSKSLSTEEHNGREKN